MDRIYFALETLTAVSHSWSCVLFIYYGIADSSNFECFGDVGLCHWLVGVSQGVSGGYQSFGVTPTPVTAWH
jgi:hypothetical protein